MVAAQGMCRRVTWLENEVGVEHRPDSSEEDPLDESEEGDSDRVDERASMSMTTLARRCRGLLGA